MVDRRRFIQSIAAAASIPAVGYGCVAQPRRATGLKNDTNGLIDLPDGFTYNIVSQRGTPMSDGLVVPGAHDGMAAFDADDGRITLICNHELTAPYLNDSPFGQNYHSLPESFKQRVYDRGRDLTPGLGGTTTTLFDPSTATVERQFLSLAGTEYNCAGGKTPWGSWLTCEENFTNPGTAYAEDRSEYWRDRRHGYVFEVPSAATELVDAVPLTAMGRFEHEAAAVHESSGAVYMTEDRYHSLFYRFLPNVPGLLQEGGTLQALALVGKAAKKTNNWGAHDIRVGEALQTRWVDLDNVNSDEDDLRNRGRAAGAAVFARGEGLTAADDRFAFTCTIGGPARLGQVFTYKPSPFEATAREQEAPGELTLIAEANQQSLLRNCDNLTMAPWGDLIVCEDTAGHCGLVGIRPDGRQYLVAYNAYSSSELAGVCFSPDGGTMFLNIQYPGTTLAITGPWEKLSGP